METREQYLERRRKTQRKSLSTRLKALGCKLYEVDPGRSVPNDWDKALVEPWAERKARRARERAATEHRA